MTVSTSPEQTKAAIMALFNGFTMETTPKSAEKIPAYDQRLRHETPIYVTFLPGSNVQDTVALCKRIVGEGFTPIPHIAARSLESEQMLKDLASAYVDMGLEKVLCIAGGVEDKDIKGPFNDSMQVLDSGILDKAGIKKISVAGHPEGSPDMGDDAIQAALDWKNKYAESTGAQLDICTQFAFEGGPVLAWERRIRAAGNKLPIIVGFPGVATIKTLLNFGMAAGVGNSLKFIRKRAMDVTKLLTVNAPDELAVELAVGKAADPDCLIQGVHMYAIGGLKKTSFWAYALADGKFDVTPKGGIKLHEPLP